MKKTLIGLTALILGACSVDSANLLYSRQYEKDIFGGVTEEYRPEQIKLELEHDLTDNTKFTVSPFYETFRDDYGFGMDLGLKHKFKEAYLREGIGYGYESKDFERHDFRQNIHLDFGMGIEYKNFIIGGVFNHWSTGQAITNRETHRDNGGINYGGLQLGFKF